ncbi:MAG: aldolase [Alphaproteobacteria bacterium]|jgi:2-keto-3-deoxy-L-rhamnonate aldolase RhmA|nr:aldolase [Alphaproteobacteria bacterium]
MSEALREVLRGTGRIVGSFVKTPSHHVVEVFGISGLDCLVIDAEHAPFSAGDLDRMCLAGRAVGIPILVRVASPEPAAINGCLDLGATGILVPHVRDAAAATAAVAAARYRGGVRGFSPSTRAGGYGRFQPSAYLDHADRSVSVWCQIEDAEALDQLDAIAAVPGVDCLFVGRADLALSLGVAGNDDLQIGAALTAVAAACARAGIAAGIFVADAAEIPALVRAGYRCFIVGSDQSLLLAAGRQVAQAASGPT